MMTFAAQAQSRSDSSKINKTKFGERPSLKTIADRPTKPIERPKKDIIKRKRDTLSDVRTRSNRDTSKDEQRIKEAREKASKITARIKAARLKKARSNAARIKAARLKKVRSNAARIKAARLKKARSNAARIKAARLKKARSNAV